MMLHHPAFFPALLHRVMICDLHFTASVQHLGIALIAEALLTLVESCSMFEIAESKHDSTFA